MLRSLRSAPDPVDLIVESSSCLEVIVLFNSSQAQVVRIWTGSENVHTGHEDDVKAFES